MNSAPRNPSLRLGLLGPAPPLQARARFAHPNLRSSLRRPLARIYSQRTPSTATKSHPLFAVLVLAVIVALGAVAAAGQSYPVVDTAQSNCYDEDGNQIACPAAGAAFHGQDAQHQGPMPQYVDHGNGTVSDQVTGLMWQQTPVWDITYAAAVAGASSVTTGGHTDWRLPTINELYSLIDFDGVTGTSAADSTPYLDTAFFDFEYGDVAAGERFIDAQYSSSTEYVWTTMSGDETVFGVNFADGRIKGYGIVMPGGSEKTFDVRYVRDAAGYGANDFLAGGDGTVSDRASGLMWAQADSGFGMNWQEALAWVEQRNVEAYLGHDDWRLPEAKELHSLVDYTRSPDTHSSAAIDPLFVTTAITNEGGAIDYPFFWTSTTHLDGPTDIRGSFAVYVAFGRALGWMEQPPGSGNYQLLDVHGAGAQRSDPKSGDPAGWPHGNGPQGDVVRIDNFVRLVREDSLSVSEIFADGFESGDFAAWSSSVP